MPNILGIIFLFLPAGIANASPVLFKRVQFLNYPVCEKFLGNHKTWRGLFFGILMATLVVFIQTKIQIPEKYTLVNYAEINPLILGPLLGAGALIGDMLKSFFKRRIGIAPGKPWVPFDQTDWIIMSVLVTLPYTHLDLVNVLSAIVIFGLLHPAFNLLSYFLKLQKVKI